MGIVEDVDSFPESGSFVTGETSGAGADIVSDVAVDDAAAPTAPFATILCRV